MAKIIVNDQGRINTFLAGIDDEDIITIAPHGDGKILVAVKSTAAPILAPTIQEKIIEKEVEVIKEVEVDNPKLLKEIENLTAKLAKCNEKCKALEEKCSKLKKALEAIE